MSRLDRWREATLPALVALLDTGEPTRLAHESAARHGLRSGLCLVGWRWSAADEEAAGLVAKALARMGVGRPSWKEGQPEWTQDGALARLRTCCGNCGKELPEALGDKPRTYCSRVCAHAAQMRHRRRDKESEERAAQQAWGLAWQARQPETTCHFCGERFRPKWPRKPPPKYCSPSCYQRSRDKDRARVGAVGGSSRR